MASATIGRVNSTGLPRITADTTRHGSPVLHGQPLLLPALRSDHPSGNDQLTHDVGLRGHQHSQVLAGDA